MGRARRKLVGRYSVCGRTGPERRGDRRRQGQRRPKLLRGSEGAEGDEATETTAGADAKSEE